MNTQSSVGSMSSLCTTHLAQKAWGRSWGLVRGVERRVRLVLVFAQSECFGCCMKKSSVQLARRHASQQASERSKQPG